MAFDVSPPRDCGACPRLAEYRAANRCAYPEWSNAPVASFGEASARLLIVGLAPGLRGANRTGRPFTGDYAGDLLYQTLIRFGFAAGVYDRRPDDGLELVDCAIVNAVRCAPPQNKPTPAGDRGLPRLSRRGRSARSPISRWSSRSAGWRTAPCCARSARGRPTSLSRTGRATR